MKITQQAADAKAGMTLDEAAQTSPYLPQAPRANRLPPKWDGATVEWEEWEVGTVDRGVRANSPAFPNPLRTDRQIRTDLPSRALGPTPHPHHPQNQDKE